MKLQREENFMYLDFDDLISFIYDNDLVVQQALSVGERSLTRQDLKRLFNNWIEADLD